MDKNDEMLRVKKEKRTNFVSAERQRCTERYKAAQRERGQTVSGSISCSCVLLEKISVCCFSDLGFKEKARVLIMMRFIEVWVWVRWLLRFSKNGRSNGHNNRGGYDDVLGSFGKKIFSTLHFPIALSHRSSNFCGFG